MKKNLGMILVLSLLFIGSGNTFEFIGSATVKNVERCINNSSKLLTETDNETRCVIKYQKKVKRDITKGKANHESYGTDIALRATITNTSNDIVITGIQIKYNFRGTYEGNYGTIDITENFNGDPKIDKITSPEYLSNWWLEPGETNSFFLSIQEYFNCYHVKGNSNMYIKNKTRYCDSEHTIEAKEEFRFYKGVNVNFKNKNFKYDWRKLEKDSWSWHISEVYGVYIK